MPDLVSPSEALSLIKSGARTIDVRSLASRQKFGTVDGSVAVDKADVTATFADGAGGVSTDRTRHVLVYCGSEKGSEGAAAEIEALGYENVSHVLGGFPALKDHGVPISGGSDTLSV